MIFPIFAPSHPEYVGVDPPRKQMSDGVAPEHVICKEGLVLFIKYNGSAACVKYETAVKLEDRGWGGMPPPCCKPTEVSSIESFEECVAAGNPVMESHPRQCRTPDGKHFVESIQEIETTEFEKNDFAIPSHDCSGSAGCFTGSVTQIIDGDTIKVDGKSIRFALTSTPELNKSGGQEARAFIENICPVGSLALVDEDDGQTQGSYGRIIAVIYCNDMNLNEEILDAGLGDLSTGFCSISEFSIHPWAKKYGC